jgi:hypothetical protein
MKNKYIFLIIGVTFLLCIIIIKGDWSFLTRNVHCSEKEIMKKYDFKAVVIEKYNDFKNHNYNSIIILDFEKNKKLKLYFINEKSGFYNNVIVKDTLIKQKNSLVITNVSQKKSFSLKYNCDE